VNLLETAGTGKRTGKLIKDMPMPKFLARSVFGLGNTRGGF